MSATGELYANETCRDVCEKDLNKTFGENGDAWTLEGGSYGDVWNEEDLPEIMRIKVNDGLTDEQIGLLIVKNKFEVLMGVGGRYIEAYPESWEIWDLRKGVIEKKLE